jgi:hypothetical protein
VEVSNNMVVKLSLEGERVDFDYSNNVGSNEPPEDNVPSSDKVARVL